MWHNLLARLKQTPPWVWITVAIAAAGLIISFLIYRQSQGNAPASGGTSQSGAVNPGDTTGGYSPYGNNSSQYQPDYTTQSLLQQIINLLQGQQAGTGAKPPTPSPTPSPGGTPGVTPGAPGALPPAVQHHPITGRPAYSPPSVQPHPITGHPGMAPPPLPRPVVGSVAHADDHRGTRPHPGAIMVTPSSHQPGQTA